MKTDGNSCIIDTYEIVTKTVPSRYVVFHGDDWKVEILVRARECKVGFNSNKYYLKSINKVLIWKLNQD